MPSVADGIALLGPDPGGRVRRAVAAGGASVVAPERAAGAIWLGGELEELRQAVAAASNLRWVQLPSAGVEAYGGLMAERDDIVWTCAKGIFGPAVAEQALALLLALRRGLAAHAAADSWSPSVPSRPLVGSDDVVTVLGGGGIALGLAELLAPFGVRLRVVRRHPDQGFSARHDSIFGDDELHAALVGAQVLVVTLPLTKQTHGLVGEQELRLLDAGAQVINVGRGAVLDHEALLMLLDQSLLGGAALDVTHPEPLPPQSRLWSHPRCIITSHTSNPDAWRHERFADLVRENLLRLAAGEELRGQVSPAAGY